MVGLYLPWIPGSRALRPSPRRAFGFLVGLEWLVAVGPLLGGRLGPFHGSGVGVCKVAFPPVIDGGGWLSSYKNNVVGLSFNNARL